MNTCGGSIPRTSDDSIPDMRHSTIGLGAILLSLAAALPTQAQTTNTITINGRAINPQGGAMPGLEVLLHRVDAAGGAQLGSVTTDSTGAFSVTAETDPDTSAVYFAAARYNDELYIGPFVREGDARQPYILEVGGQPVDLGAPLPASMPPVSPGDSPRRQLIILFPLLGLLGLAIWFIVQAARPPTRRRAIIRLAALDEQIADVGGDPQLESERERILERLLAE